MMKDLQPPGRGIKAQTLKIVQQVVDHLKTSSDYFEIGLILVTPSKDIYAITMYHGRIDHKEVVIARGVAYELIKNGIKVIQIKESIRNDIILKKTAGLNRRNVSGWSQSGTILECTTCESNNPENVRDLYLIQKAARKS